MEHLENEDIFNSIKVNRLRWGGHAMNEVDCNEIF